jgi:DNA-binding protein H-NS
MHVSDLETLSFEDLWRLHEELTKILAEKLVAEKFELERRLALLRQSHFISEPGGAEAETESGATPRHAKLPPKYRNDSVAGETWTGRGKRPRWLVEAIRLGRKIDEFRIGETVQKTDESKKGGS